MAEINTALPDATHFVATSSTSLGEISPNGAQKLLWSATRRIDVAAENNLTLSSDEATEGTAVHTQIQAAIDAMNTAGGGVVYLRPGVWWISASIQMKSRVHLMGDAYGGTVIKLLSNSNVHCFVNGTTNAELYSIGNLRINGNRDGQGIPAFTQNIWVNGLHLSFNTGGSYTFVDPQCYFYNLYVQLSCCDNIYIDGRGGHVGYNIHTGDCRRWGANLTAWDSIFYGMYVGGCGGDGFRVSGGPIFLLGCKSFFVGTRTAALSDASLRLVHASSPITPSGEDWRYGSGFRIEGAAIMSSCESQDTCGHGLMVGVGANTITGHRFGNIGSLSRHFGASYPNAAALTNIACAFLGGGSGNHITGTVADQFTENSGEQPQCDWLIRSNSETVRQNIVDIGCVPYYVRMSGGRYTQTMSAKDFLGNDFRIGNEVGYPKIANFTAVKADHRQTWFLKSPLTTITAVAATVGNGWAVRLINKTGGTVTAGGQSVTNSQDGVLSSDGANFTFTNGASLSSGRVRELLASTTINVEYHDSIILGRAALTITGTAASLGDGFRCTVYAAGGAVTWGSQTIDDGNRADVQVVNGAVRITETTPASA